MSDEKRSAGRPSHSDQLREMQKQIDELKKLSQASPASGYTAESLVEAMETVERRRRNPTPSLGKPREYPDDQPSPETYDLKGRAEELATKHGHRLGPWTQNAPAPHVTPPRTDTVSWTSHCMGCGGGVSVRWVRPDSADTRPPDQRKPEPLIIGEVCRRYCRLMGSESRRDPRIATQFHAEPKEA